MSLRTPAFRLVRDGATLPPFTYTKTGRTGSVSVSGIADAPRILELFHDGATIVFQGMHRYWAPLAGFCRDLELALGHPTQVNAYITPPGSRGLAVHSDSHDVFVLQAFGTKHWDAYEAPPALPSGHTRGPAGDPGEPVLTAVLQPGESLYIPRGTPHAAATQEVLSGHLTVGVLSYTWADLLRDLFTEVEREPEMREPLPAGYHRSRERFRAAVEDRLRSLHGFVDKADPEELAERMVRRFLTSRQPIVATGLQDLHRLGSIDDRTVLRRRDGSVCELGARRGRLEVLLGDRELHMPAAFRPAMELIGGRERFRVGDLSELLDEESRLVLSRRLVREGLLEISGDG